MLNYTALVGEIIADIAATVPALSHIDPARVAVVCSSRRTSTSCGCLATCIGLSVREEPTFSIWVRRSSREVVRVSRWFRHRAVRVTREGTDCRYIIQLRLPRMLDNDPLETIVHEMFHISEDFDGGLRPMRHGASFDRHVHHLMKEWSRAGDPRLVELARMTRDELHRRERSFVAWTLPATFRSVITEPVQAPCDYDEGLRRFFPRYRLAPDYSVDEARTTPAATPREIETARCDLRAWYPDGNDEKLTLPVVRLLARRDSLTL